MVFSLPVVGWIELAASDAWVGAAPAASAGELTRSAIAMRRSLSAQNVCFILSLRW
jgi:hypothetical protein